MNDYAAQCITMRRRNPRPVGKLSAALVTARRCCTCGRIMVNRQQPSSPLGPAWRSRTSWWSPTRRAAYEALRSRGAAFLTPPHDWGTEIRCFLRDPDGHLVEISQSKAS